MAKIKLYLVVGGESTGTKFTTMLLTEAGVFGDPENETQRMNKLVADKKFDEIIYPAVWKRSCPAGPVWWKFYDMIGPLLENGLDIDDVLVIVTTRDWYCAACSAVNRGHSKTFEDAMDKLSRAYQRIFNEIAKHNMKYKMTSYDILSTGSEKALASFYEQMDMLADKRTIEKVISKTKNQNLKHLGMT